MIEDRVTTVDQQRGRASPESVLSTPAPDRGAVASAEIGAATLPRRRWLPRLPVPSIGLHTSERTLLLGVMDVGLLIAALIIAVKVRTDWLDGPGAVFDVWRWYVTLALVWWVIAQLLEVYDLARAASAPHSILAAGSAAALTTVVYHMIPLYTPPLTSRGLSVLFGLLAVGFIVLWRGIYAVLFVQPNFQQRAIVLGAGYAGQALAAEL